MSTWKHGRIDARKFTLVTCSPFRVDFCSPCIPYSLLCATAATNTVGSVCCGRGDGFRKRRFHEGQWEGDDEASTADYFCQCGTVVGERNGGSIEGADVVRVSATLSTIYKVASYPWKQSFVLCIQ